MSKRHADSTPDEKTPHSTTLSADEVLVEAARNGDTTAVRVGLEKLSPDTDSETVAFDAVHEACRGDHDECLALLLPYVETTQMGFGMLLSECIHADHTACTEVLLQHWKSVCSNVAFVPHGQEDKKDRPCPAMWEDPAVCQVLIDAGADIETKDDMGHSPLHWSCCSGALDVVKMLVESGAGVCATAKEGSTRLRLAAGSGHTETVRYLVGLNKVDVNHKDTDGYTALLHAAEEGHPDVVEVLIDAGADIEVKDKHGLSPLLVASEFGHLPIVKTLVRAGAGVCVADNRADTCLSLAAHYGHTKTVRALLCMPEVDVNQSNNRSGSSLHHAVLQKHSDVSKLLIDAGADIDAKDDRGSTPLHCACEEPELEIVQMLLAAGADVCAVDDKRVSCLNVAAKYGRTQIVRYLVGVKGVDVNQSNTQGFTPLHRAVAHKHSDVVQVLIDAGADIDAGALHCACTVRGELDTVKMLVKAGADVSVQDDHGRTCLILAVSYGYTETVRYLAGLPEVDVNQKNLFGHTALQHARQKQHKHMDVVHVLLDHGAKE